MKALKNEYLKKKEFLENKKRKLIQEYQQIGKEDLGGKKDKTREIMAVDFQMKENEKLKVDEEKEIIFSMSKREKHSIYSIFEYEDWMDPILINNVVENLFDFGIALKLIQVDLKNRNVPNYDLFNILELRSRWTDIELKHFRKIKNGKENDDSGNKESNFSNESLLKKESDKMLNAEKDKRIILSTIKEAKIDESVFMDMKDIKQIGVNKDVGAGAVEPKQENMQEDGYEKRVKQVQNELKDNVNKVDNAQDTGKEKEKGFNLHIKEEAIDFSELD